MGAKKTTILAVDDEPRMLKLVAFNLEAEGFAALTTTDGRHALELVKTHSPDLVLLDLTMPEMDGFTLCQSIRQSSAVPIIILTARGQDQDKVRGFELGADDYLTKPFSVEELIARIRAVIRRAQVTTNDSAYALQSTMTIGPLTLDDARHEVRMAGREIVLAPLEYRLLFYLAQNAGRVVTQEQLLEHIWGEEYGGEGHLLRVNMSRLRSKLEPDPAHPRYLLTKVGIGYLLATTVAEQ
jgi:DNA-binding response OmpR family regulator